MGISTITNTSILSVPIVQAQSLTVDDLKQIARTTAKDAGLNVEHFLGTIDCETKGTWNPSIQSEASSTTDVGGREESWGLVQIHLPDHKDITKAQAINPHFAINWMRDEWLKGNAWEWSCWNALYGK